MRPLGVNTWVWTASLTDAALPDLARRIAGLGFDAIELPLEQPGDLTVDGVRAALDGTGLAPYVVGAMAPGRDLVATDPDTVAATQDYLRACVDLAAGIGAPSVCGPFYAATGRVWRMSPSERAAAYAEWRDHLAPVVEHAAHRGVGIGIEPLNRYETSLVNTVDQALTGLGGPAGGVARAGARHLPPPHRGAVHRRRRPGGRRPPRPRPGLRQRPRSAGRRPGRLGRAAGRSRRRRLRRSRSTSRASPPTTRPSPAPPRSGGRSPPRRTPSRPTGSPTCGR